MQLPRWLPYVGSVLGSNMCVNANVGTSLLFMPHAPFDLIWSYMLHAAAALIILQQFNRGHISFLQVIVNVNYYLRNGPLSCLCPMIEMKYIFLLQFTCNVFCFSTMRSAILGSRRKLPGCRNVYKRLRLPWVRKPWAQILLSKFSVLYLCASSHFRPVSCV